MSVVSFDGDFVKKATPLPVLLASQCRAARGFLGWSQIDLAKASGVSRQAIQQFELDESTPTRETLDKLTAAFTKHLELTPDGGIRPRQRGRGKLQS
jgi:transcriptional regulator with XRE-family HTH domain